MEQEVAQSGLLRALADACSVLTDVLQQRRQQQQQQRRAEISSTAAAYLLSISRLVLQVWNCFPLPLADNSLLSNSSMLEPTMLPVAGLVLEVLYSSSADLTAARRIASGSGSVRGRVSGSQGSGVCMTLGEGSSPKSVCPMLAALHAMFNTSALVQHGTSPLQGADIMLQLLLVNLGCVAEAQHHKHKGLPPAPAAAAAAPPGAAAPRSSTSRGSPQKSSRQSLQQQGPVPAYHQQLLEALGVCSSTATLRGERLIVDAVTGPWDEKSGYCTPAFATNSLTGALIARSGAHCWQPHPSLAEPMQQSSGSAGDNRASSSSGSSASATHTGSSEESSCIIHSFWQTRALPTVRERSEGPLLAAGLLQPVLLTLLELQLLAPGHCVIVNGVQAMQLLRCRMGHELDAAAAVTVMQPLLQLLAPAVSAFAQDSTSPQAQLAGDASEWDGVRHSMKLFHEMVVKLSLKVPSPQLVAMIEQQPQLTLTALEAALRGAAIAAEEDEALYPNEFKQHKLASCAAHLLHVCGSYLTAHTQPPASSHNISRANSLCITTSSRSSSCSGSGSSSSIAASDSASTGARASSSSGSASDAHLLSLALSCCKAFSKATCVAGNDMAYAVLFQAARALFKLCLCPGTDACNAVFVAAAQLAAGAGKPCCSSSSRSNPGSSAASPTGGDPWCPAVLAARAVQLVGQVLAAQAAVRPEEATAVAEHLSVVSSDWPDTERDIDSGPEQLLRELLRGISLLGSHLSLMSTEVGFPGEPAAEASGATAGAAPSRTLLQLLKQHAAVMQGLQAVLDVYSGAETYSEDEDTDTPDASAEEGVAMATAAAAGPRAWVWGLGQVAGPMLARQLQEFGAAVCGQLPLPHCCNSPLCQNMGQGSELQLVGGSGSRCSRCRTARYCSRECQVAHWGQHKAVCKRLQQPVAKQ